MPGVSDAERRTRLKQEQINRSKDREELLRMVEEGRLHEADERQLEMLRLALDLNQILESKKEAPSIDTEALAGAIKSALEDVVSKIPTVANTTGPTPSGASDPARPKMRHVDLTTIKHSDSGVKISHDDTLTQEKESDEDSSDKLRRLRELKGPPGK